MFDAVVIEKEGSGQQSVAVRAMTDDMLPEGDVTVRVEWSTLNYKDALALTGRGAIVRQFPMVPGVDFAGCVEQSSCASFAVGDRVLLNGWGVGERHWGGLAGKARVKSEWLTPVPAGMTTRQTMELGTAGYTAMLCVEALRERGVTPETGPVVVTGATGGVGSLAVMLLAGRGYHVVAVTGRAEESDWLKTLGAAEILPRASLSQPGRPLEKARWAGAVDVAGGQVLANICASMMYGGVVTACGLASSMEFPATVAPFILRGVSLIGIDSVMCPQERREKMWTLLAQEISFEKIMVTEISLDEAVSAAADLLDGKISGRVLVRVKH
ncbi:MAG: oxidoreductase [Acetobacter sp.]|jgi:acrylyl-CoA reductase (NADPH)|nr:oxidoreductase [Acetobacter sp.]MCH4062243.1 oxidoreductase [Acetobacter sp.]MCH4088910.1 oxidoreductase [Acetobacter sp.]MCI1292813.1 oxidoreductase [Acetobacter sp.]MCI1319086.1 oxidoreductase [Acetobacter sp.]